MSPETWRGFSGEGQALSDLAGAAREQALDQVRESLAWDAVIDADRLARALNLDPDAVRAALAVLGSRGLVGYDLESGDYFHRELPFDLDLVEKLQPRLQNARKLIDSGGVRLVRQDADGIEAYVQGTGVEHRVVIDADDNAKCTCPWFHRHHGDRGPCKHVLAVRMVVEEE